jgi:hypothetical protein
MTQNHSLTQRYLCIEQLHVSVIYSHHQAKHRTINVRQDLVRTILLRCILVFLICGSVFSLMITIYSRNLQLVYIQTKLVLDCNSVSFLFPYTSTISNHFCANVGTNIAAMWIMHRSEITAYKRPAGKICTFIQKYKRMNFNTLVCIWQCHFVSFICSQRMNDMAHGPQ